MAPRMAAVMDFPGGAAKAHELPVAERAPDRWCPQIAGPAVTPVVCDSAQTASAGLRHADPVSRRGTSCVQGGRCWPHGGPLVRLAGRGHRSSAGDIGDADDARRDPTAWFVENSRIRRWWPLAPPAPLL